MEYRSAVRVHCALVLTMLWSAPSAAPLPDRAPAALPPTPLEQYVYTPDSAYGYALSDSLPVGGTTVHTLLMDSLRWRSDAEVDRTLWTHELVVIVPPEPRDGTALYLINGGSDASEPLDPAFVLAGVPLAEIAGSVLAIVSQIPNQPLLFTDQPEPISEDALVAYSWERLMDTGEQTWAAYMPMTKAAVRGMDAVQDFVASVHPANPITGFVVTGFSKRGATAWLTAAVDPRVRAVAPGVFDVLDIPLQIERHYRAYGFYAPAVQDYVEYGVVRRGRSPEGRLLARNVDPLSYAALLAMPKMLLNSTGDQFFLPDSANFYLDRLPGETLVYQVPNTDHSLSDGFVDALGAILAWFEAVKTNSPRPAISWERQDDGTLVVSAEPAPTAVSLWQATNPDARDFRLETLGPAWTDTALEPDADGRYRVRLEAPPQGYTGYLVSMSFPGSGGIVPQQYSTPVMIAPDTLPFELRDPVVAPRGARYWRCQLPNAIACDGPADFTAGELEALLPFPVFGRYVTQVDALRANLAPSLAGRALAVRACTATRLNIAIAALGWYSQVEGKELWRSYEQAEIAFVAGRPRIAARICRALNAAPGGA